MDAKKNLLPALARVLAMLLIMAAYPAANMLIDPFGVFGDPIFDWYSYNETNNPRAAKLAWLEDHHQQFDSYIIGSSCSASFSPAELNEYLDASFYNLFAYGSDAKDYLDHAAYLLEHYEVKHLVLNLNLTEATLFDTGEDDVHYRTHALASGKSLSQFYLQYAFCEPQYALEKLQARFSDTLLPQSFDVFDAASGCYDKRVRDVEKIGSRTAYEDLHGDDFYFDDPSLSQLSCLEQSTQAVARIRDLCAEKGVDLLVICSPAYCAQLDSYGQEALLRYRSALAEVVDFWDFSCTSLSYDSRYFYDASHFRNAVGSMVLAEIFGNTQVYRPENFGVFVTSDNGGASAPRPGPLDESAYTKEVPVLMYHHFSDEGGEAVSAEAFASHLEALSQAGYTAVTPQEMIDYVYRGSPLPDKPILITMDDGYQSNYDVAWPLLEQYKMKAAVFAIGSSVGHKEFYKDTQFPLTPHFGWEEAREMLSSGAMDIQSHTYDMHQWAPFESGDQLRPSALPLDGESDEAYAAALTADLARYDEERRQELGAPFCALAYPSGEYNTLTEVLVHQSGIPLTFSIRSDQPNVLIQGLPQSLYALCRLTIDGSTTADALLSMLP